MKNGTTRSAVLALLVIGLSTMILLNRHDLFGEAQAQSQVKSQKWEYCYVSSPFFYGTNGVLKVDVSQGGEKWLADSDLTGVAALNKLGAEGWELVSASDELIGSTPPNQTRFLLKRPKQ